MFINKYIMEGKKKHDDIILSKKCDKNLWFGTKYCL